MAEPAAVARTHGERSADMQRRLMDATLASLSERGYRGTTTLEVQRRAGVSRGALLHHYKSRSELILAAVDHLARERMAEVLRLVNAHPPDAHRMRWAVGVIWATFDGPLFAASLELWLAARTDEELLDALIPQERVIGRTIRDISADLFGAELGNTPDFTDTLEILLDAMRGAAARSVLRGTDSDRRLLASWERLLEERLQSTLTGMRTS
jgi:AcrR family transcriptional regulator